MPNYSGMWSLSQQFQGRGQGLWPTPPGAPTIGTAAPAGVGIATVAFTAPACTGVPAGITGYIAKSTPGCFTATGSSSPITISGLSSTTAYTFAVAAQNASGYGAYSAQSNSVTPNAVIGQDAYTTAGTYTWVKPAGVTSVSIVAVGAGGRGGSGQIVGNYPVCWCSYSGGGGAGSPLTYRNGLSVSSYASLTIVVAAGSTSGNGSEVKTCAGTSIFTSGYGQNANTYIAGTPVAATGTYTASYAGGNGANGAYTACNLNQYAGGGGGAGGYSGAGTNGGGCSGASSAAATGGAASGGSGGSNSNTNGGGGGGVGILGQGASGAASSSASSGGKGGSGGADGTAGNTTPCRARAGAYGGGGGGGYSGSFSPSPPGCNTGGAVRIIYPGNTRSFPSTCTGNL